MGSGSPGERHTIHSPFSCTQECTLKVQDGKFKLQDLLVVPMQRVLKYHLLLKVRPPFRKYAGCLGCEVQAADRGEHMLISDPMSNASDLLDPYCEILRLLQLICT